MSAVQIFPRHERTWRALLRGPGEMRRGVRGQFALGRDSILQHGASLCCHFGIKLYTAHVMEYE